MLYGWFTGQSDRGWSKPGGREASAFGTVLPPNQQDVLLLCTDLPFPELVRASSPLNRCPIGLVLSPGAEQFGLSIVTSGVTGVDSGPVTS